METAGVPALVAHEHQALHHQGPRAALQAELHTFGGSPVQGGEAVRIPGVWGQAWQAQQICHQGVTALLHGQVHRCQALAGAVASAVQDHGHHLLVPSSLLGRRQAGGGEECEAAAAFWVHAQLRMWAHAITTA